MTDKQELLPCPYCGEDVSLEQPQYEESDEWWGVICRSTKNLGGTCAIEQTPSRTKQAAIKRWNTRAKTQREKELEEALKDILENIEDLPPEFSKIIDDNYWDLV